MKHKGAAHETIRTGLMERYQNNLFAAAFNVCKSREDAEDVVQDTFCSTT